MAYLGPKGTYAEKAAETLSKLEKFDNVELVSCIGLRSVIEHAAKKLCEAAVVPIENSVEGGVTASLDALWVHPDLFISRAVVLPIQHSLLGSGSLNEVSEVLSHPQALAQCSGWLNKHLPQALLLPTNSTAEAARMVRGSRFRAAIASKTTTNMEGLNELGYPINDIAGNCTRFVLVQNKNVSREGNVGSLAFSLHKNSPGALMKALSCIETLGLNMSRIESRPSKRELGEYIFFVDVELIKSDESKYQELIEDLNPLCQHLVNFGCYKSNNFEDI